MNGGGRTCPSCGRKVRQEHQLCVKCGTRLEASDPKPGRPAPGRRAKLLALIGAAAAATVLLVLLLWRLTGSPERTLASPEESGDRPATPAGEERTPGRDHGPTRAPQPPIPPGPSPRPRKSPPPALPPGFPPAPPLMPPTPGTRPGSARSFVEEVRRCVDARRQGAERDCAAYGRYLGQTSESLCLIGKVAAIYWRCLSTEAGAARRCLRRCGSLARRCALGCVGDERQRQGLGAGRCLLRCWQSEIDPCLGPCLRP